MYRFAEKWQLGGDVRTNYLGQTDRQTDGQTDGRTDRKVQHYILPLHGG